MNAKSASGATTEGANEDRKGSRRTRRTTLFPARTFEDALELPTAIFRMASGQTVRRITLLDGLSKSPTSSATRQLITNSSKYGLTTGSYNSETLGLTDGGLRVVGEQQPAADRTRACFELAIQSIDIFKKLYESYVDARLPASAVLMDKAREFGIPDGDLAACIETFTVNAKYVGVLRSISGAERFISLDTLVDDYTQAETFPEKQTSPQPQPSAHPIVPTRGSVATTKIDTPSDFESACFYITPIGDEDSEARKHADLFMGSLVEPAIEEFGLTVVRADQIGQAGMITRQIIEYIMHSKLVIADLSFHNPNVFYELALRHAVRKPIVQITRNADRLPFDIGQVRTVVVDTTDIYTLVPQLSSLQAQIAAQIRKTLQEGSEVENPLSVFAPNFWSSIPGS